MEKPALSNKKTQLWFGMPFTNSGQKAPETTWDTHTHTHKPTNANKKLPNDTMATRLSATMKCSKEEKIKCFAAT